VYHQGAGYSAIPATIPFLIELLDVPAARDKAGILDLLALLSEAHRWIQWGLRETFDKPEPSAWIEQADHGVYAAAYEAVYKDVSVYQRLLDHSDADARVSAARVLSFHPGSAEGTLPLVLDRLAAEKNTRAKVSLLLSVGWLIRHTGRDDLLPLLRQQLQAKRSLLRFAGAAGLCNAGQPADLDVQRVLWRTMVVGEDEVDLPWANGDPDYYALDLLHAVHLLGQIDARDLLLDAFVEVSKATRGLRTRELDRHRPILQGLVERLLLVIFPRPQRREPATWEDLDRHQRRTLRALRRHLSPAQTKRIPANYLDSLLRDAGLPRFAELGSLPELPPRSGGDDLLDEPLVVGPEHAPLMEWWSRAAAGDDPEPQVLFDAMMDQLCTSEIHEAIERLLARDRQGQRTLELCGELLSRLGAGDAHLVALDDRAQTLFERGFLSTTPREAWGPTRLLFAWALASASHSRGLSIPEWVDELLLDAGEFAEFVSIPNGVRLILGLLPRPRRARVIDQCSIRSFAEPHEAWPLYDLCPSATRTKKLLRLMKGDPEYFCGRAAYRVMEVLVSMADEGRAELQAALSSSRRKDRHIIAAALASRPDAGGLDLSRWREDRDQRVSELARWRSEHDPPLPDDLLVSLGIDPARAPHTDRAKGGVVGVGGRPWDGESWRR
jgi:hypothetical protein